MIFRYYNPQYMLYENKIYILLCNTTQVMLLDMGKIITYVT